MRIVSDTATLYSPEEGKNMGVTILPVYVAVNDKEYKDGVDISKEEYYEVLKNSKEIPKTSQATYMQFKEAFDIDPPRRTRSACQDQSRSACPRRQKAGRSSSPPQAF